MQQSDVYRGQILQIRGQIARIDRLSDDLSRLWVKPADGSQRPVVFLVDQLPEGLTAETRFEDSTVYAGVGTGWYVGRVTYPSVGGIETAPMFVGRMSAQSVDQLLTKLPPTAGTVGDRLTMSMVVGVLFLASGLMAYFWWDEQRKSKRTSKQQRATVPISFGQVNDVEPPH
jgi:hypothetical protein